MQNNQLLDNMYFKDISGLAEEIRETARAPCAQTNEQINKPGAKSLED